MHHYAIPAKWWVFRHISYTAALIIPEWKHYSCASDSFIPLKFREWKVHLIFVSFCELDPKSNVKISEGNWCVRASSFMKTQCHTLKDNMVYTITLQTNTHKHIYRSQKNYTYAHQKTWSHMIYDFGNQRWQFSLDSYLVNCQFFIWGKLLIPQR